MSAPLDRPRPIAEAFRSVGALIGLAGSLVAALVGWGFLTAAQGDAITGLLGAVPGAVTLVTTLLVAFGVLRRAEPQTTPVASPAVLVDGALVPLVPDLGDTDGDHDPRPGSVLVDELLARESVVGPTDFDG